MSSAPSTSSSAAAPPPFRFESLGQLYSRISTTQARCLRSLCPRLFGPAAPQPQQTIEITGTTNTGKTNLLMELIARAILPRRSGGHETHVLFLDTEHQAHPFRLSAILEKHIRAHSPTSSPDEQQVHATIAESLQRLQLLACHSPEHLELAIGRLERAFAANEQPLSMLAMDAVGTFYWAQTTPIRMDTYSGRLVARLARITRRHGAVLVYVRPDEFRTAVVRRTTAADSSAVGELAEMGTAAADTGGAKLKPEKKPSAAAKAEDVDFTVVLQEQLPGASGDRLFEAIAMRGGRLGGERLGQFAFGIDEFGIQWIGEDRQMDRSNE